MCSVTTEFNHDHADNENMRLYASYPMPTDAWVRQHCYTDAT